MNDAVAALALLFLLWQVDGASAASTGHLNCNVGPITRTLGNSNWLIFSCDDDKTLIFVASEGSPAAPFYFRASPKQGGYGITGEGTGGKEATDAAYNDISKLSTAEIERLIADTKQVRLK
jgi:hypothetical protein